jgi:hypothetical protein
MALAVAALMFNCVSIASAQTYAIPDGASFAVTDQFLYWERWSPRSCRDCGELWRMPVAGGRHQLVDRVRKGRVDFLAGGGHVMAYTTIRDGTAYRTEVHAINDDGQRGTLARASYLKNARKNCGQEVSSGAVSAEGEVAWQLLNVPSPDDGCDQLYGNLVWSAYAAGIGSPVRRILSPRSREMHLWEAGDYQDILEDVSPVVAFEGSTLLAGSFLGTLEIHRVPDGEMVRVAGGPKAAFSGLADVATNGAVYADVLVADSTGWNDFVESPRLLLQPIDPARQVDISIAGQTAPEGHFCGGQLVQIAAAKDRLQMTRRSLDATILASQTILSGGSDYEASFQCNETTAVVQYEVWNKFTKKSKFGTFGVALVP